MQIRLPIPTYQLKSQIIYGSVAIRLHQTTKDEDVLKFAFRNHKSNGSLHRYLDLIMLPHKHVFIKALQRLFAQREILKTPSCLILQNQTNPLYKRTRRKETIKMKGTIGVMLLHMAFTTSVCCTRVMLLPSYIFSINQVVVTKHNIPPFLFTKVS